MAVNKVDYRVRRSEDTNRNHSPTIWGDCPIAVLQEDPRKGIYFRDDFVRTALLATPTITTEAYYANGWKAFGSAGGTLVGAFIEGGMGLKADEATDNEGVGFSTLARPFKLSRSSGKFWWECRLKVSTVADTTFGVLAGLIDAHTLSATVPLTAAGALADENFVGFHRLEGDGDQLDTVYKADGVTAVTVKADALGDLPTTTALAADTYVKLGMKYEPGYGEFGAYQLKFFVNGYELPNRKQIPSTDGDDFPNDVQLGLVFAMLCAATAAATLTVDWVEAAQEYVGDSSAAV